MAEPGISAEFYKEAVLMSAKSHEAGRPIYEDFDFVRIRVAGDEKSLVERKARDADKARFHEEWARYTAGAAHQVVGTRIEMWPALTPAMVKNLHSLNIFTIEAMAELSDMGCQHLGMGALKLREDAKRYLNGGNDAAELRKLADAQAAQLAQMQQQMAEMQAQMAAMNTPVDAPQPKSAESGTLKLKNKAN